MQLTSGMCHSQRQRGFSLIEIMVVVVIIGILSAIAYPAYTKYVVRTHRAAVQSYMLDLSLKQSSYMADSRTYADDTTIKGLVPRRRHLRRDTRSALRLARARHKRATSPLA